ncbi:S-adenosyl methyltransferase [Herbihabitans rhizosphaerae]|uniref:S-adenosyl methyltransferase n=1 Tax=Herbihabitans rhizosphaerae TaxID=1872711 RepID=A0A4Q7KGW2_9PSEU|nr:SAM-dependent methyltransferase [Herbihabitans rhizosphaerae]RZS32836.1 S-adenosyl methyltransferase [Herbihabitans rhizosphaerae]
MNDRPSWVPSDVDVEIPSSARIYDYLLGGAHNFSADRTVGEKMLRAMPNATRIAGANRSFLRRAVLYMLEQGITQFLDLGSGIPTVGNVHEVAQGANPDAKVAYVDYDEVAVAHSELILEGNENATVVKADFTEPNTVLSAPPVRRLLDFDKPIGLLMVGVFHFVPDEKQPHEILATYRNALPDTGALALSHLTADYAPEGMAGLAEAMRKSKDPMYLRGHDEVVSLFAGWELIEPGVVPAPGWRPERAGEPMEPKDIYAGVGRKV